MIGRIQSWFRRDWTDPARGVGTAASAPPPAQPDSTPALVSTLPAIELDIVSNRPTLPERAIVHPAPGRDRVEDRLVPLLPLSPTFLPHQEVFDVVVRRQIDGALLAQGVDFAVGADQGSIAGLRDEAPFLVLVSYSADRLRYDLIVADARSGAVSLLLGPERGNDAGEHRPEAPPGAVALAGVLVSRRHGPDLLPLVAWTGFAPAGRRAGHAAWRDRMGRALPRLRERMAAGARIVLAGYGDSITEIGYCLPGVPGASTWFEPDGPTRDHLFYFTGPVRLPPDTTGRLATEDRGDGAGPLHTRIGWNWSLLRAIEARSPSRVTYANLGIGGSASGEGVNGQGVPNGRHPERLAALEGVGAHLVSLGFGMNELGSLDTFTHTVELIGAVRAMGAEPIVWGVPLFASLTGYATLADRRLTNAALVQAAEACDAAYVPLQRIADPATPGGLGIAWRSACSCNGINHPGPAELEVYGAFGAEIVAGLR